jgi:beta-glucanase (GH16 family)
MVMHCVERDGSQGLGAILSFAVLFIQGCGSAENAGAISDEASVRAVAGDGGSGTSVEASAAGVEAEAEAAISGQDAMGNGSDGGNVIFFDDFNGVTLGAQWSAINRAGDYSNQEKECYLPSQVAVGGGNLTITTAAQRHTCGDQTHPPSGFSFVSGMVQWTSFSFLYGTVEVRARTSGGRGSWPAVWLLGKQCQSANIATADNVNGCNWPNPGSEEMDLLEVLSNDFTTAHHNVFTTAGTDVCQQTAPDTSQAFHVYTMHWAPGVLTFAVDGKAANCQIGHVPSSPAFVIINNAVSSQWPVVSADFPQVQQVDYVKVSQP